ncbi:MAG TPA: alkaline phosphatase family protein [Gaiellaceae bacterium]|nr:alkaline phosphatase family protein [Gaiellaceae bacterium]
MSAGQLAEIARGAAAGAARLPLPARSGLDHVVVVMMENRSFDHFLGWLPGADGKQAGLTFLDAAGAAHQTFPLAPDFQGCAYADPDHSYDGARVEWNNGANDGWLRAGKNDQFSIGYYTKADLPFIGAAASAFTTCDRYFAPFLGPTFPNRFYGLAGVTDRIENLFTKVTLPTIFDRLAAKKLPAAYYCGNDNFLLLWDQIYNPITKNYKQFFAAAKSGKLPAFSWVDPNYTFEDSGPQSGIGGDDHPHSDIRVGESFLSSIYDAIVRSPAWSRTLLIVTFDEWGGFFDHVPPPAGTDVDPRFAQRGFRVPCLLISPFARRAHVEHGVYDHTSILKLVEWRWGLQPLSVRDRDANNLAAALDFSHRNLSAPKIAVPQFTAGALCPA